MVLDGSVSAARAIRFLVRKGGGAGVERGRSLNISISDVRLVFFRAFPVTTPLSRAQGTPGTFPTMTPRTGALMKSRSGGSVSPKDRKWLQTHNTGAFH